MAQIAIVTDSSANLPPQVAEEHQIHVVPLMVHWEGKVYRDGVDLTPGEFYRRLRIAETLPTTAGPVVKDFLETYQRLSQQADAIISLHLPPTFSSVLAAARLAAQAVEKIPVRVVNCGTAAMGQGFVVLAAARAARAGKSLDEVVAHAEAIGRRVRVYATLERLDYLQRSGRVPVLASLAGSLLHINPIFSLNGEGGASIVEISRTRKRAITRLVEIMAAQVGNRPVHAAVFQADVPEEAEALRARIATRFRCIELYVTDVTPAMGAHTGPGILGVALYAE